MTHINVQVVQDLEPALGEARVGAVQAGVDVEDRGDEQHGQDADDDLLGGQVRQLLPHAAALVGLGGEPPAVQAPFGSRRCESG